MRQQTAINIRSALVSFSDSVWKLFLAFKRPADYTNTACAITLFQPLPTLSAYLLWQKLLAFSASVPGGWRREQAGWISQKRAPTGEENKKIDMITHCSLVTGSWCFYMKVREKRYIKGGRGKAFKEILMKLFRK